MPGFFGDQSKRLIRVNWGDDANKLAEELWSMYHEDGPLTSNQPITLYQTTDGPAITIIQGTPNPGPPIVIKKPDGTIVPLPPVTPPGGDTTAPPGGSPGSPSKPKKKPPPAPATDPDVPPVFYDGGHPIRSALALFQGSVQILVHCDGPDPYGFNLSAPAFEGVECRWYSPDNVAGTKPQTAQTFAGVSAAITKYLNNPLLAPYLTGVDFIRDDVGSPGAPCSKAGAGK